MPQQELLKRVVGVLDAAGIDYMVTGSTVSSIQGEPRSTHDIDIVVTLEHQAITQLMAAFPAPDFFLSAEAIAETLRRGRGTFNLLSTKDGDKVDFWILTAEPFDQSRFKRKYVEPVEGLPIKLSAPEDTILMKLYWANQSGGSEKQFIDALRVYEVQFALLNLNYIDDWAKRLRVEELWKRLKEQALPI
jgi:hypothetical protein